MSPIIISLSNLFGKCGGQKDVTEIVRIIYQRSASWEKLLYYPAYTTHFYTLQHLRQGGGECYQRLHKPEHFYIYAMNVWGMFENTLVGSYCLLACHHDNVMMIIILIPWMYQIMFKNRLLLLIDITCTVTLSTINTTI